MSNNIDNTPWKTSPKGACWCWYDEIQNQELLSLLKPEDGFKITIDGIEYSIIVNENGTIAVLKKVAKTPMHSSHNAHSFQPSLQQKNLIVKDYDNNRKIIDIQLVPLNKIQDVLKDGNWEISEHFPICQIKDEVVAILIKRQSGSSKTKTIEESHQ